MISPRFITDPETELMLRAGRDDPEALRVLYDRYLHPVHRQLCAMIGNHHTAEDLCQEVFFRVYRYRHAYQPRARFGTWLYHIVRSVGLNALRRERRRKRCVARERDLESALRQVRNCCRTRESESPEQHVIRREECDHVRAALHALPKRQRRVVILQQFGQLGYYEIARRLDVTPTTVQALLRRARRHLRRNLANEAADN
jgi:RNA polymerase sigma-70 factor (ECF subfamily)